MYCLHCGDCCKRMSPLSQPEPCPILKEEKGFVFCGDYENRPEQCKSHRFDQRFCPVGMDVLGLKTSDEAYLRMNQAYEVLSGKSMFDTNGQRILI